MTDSNPAATSAAPLRRVDVTSAAAKARIAKRYRSERRFRAIGLGALLLTTTFVIVLLGDILMRGLPAFTHHYVVADLAFDRETLAPGGKVDAAAVRAADFNGTITEALKKVLPGVEGRAQERALSRLASTGAGDEIARRILADPGSLTAVNREAILLSAKADLYLKGLMPKGEVGEQQAIFLDQLREKGMIEKRFNWRFFQAGDSREPELAGIRGALVGTALTLLVTLVLCLPIGVLAAIYLEEFAPKNRFTDIVEININNLAAVPSIVFGLLGLAMFLNVFGLPRSAPLVGGLVLALLVLPTIIIASRAAIRAVPPSIKEAALGVGASHQQAVFHHVLPLAMPGIMTGTIIGMAHALGETAPLLMIGMVAFIVDVPKALTDAATVLPVQIYLWSDLPEQAFKARTAGAIIVLLLVLFVMNGLAIWLRKRFERRW